MYTLSDIFKGNYPFSQKFGVNPEYYGQFTIYGVKQKGHEGVDYAIPIGVVCTSPFQGIVLRVGRQNDFPNYGNVVTVWDPVQKCAVWFCHLNDTSINVGQKVSKGQEVGHTGNTGNSSGPHLHFGLVETDAYGNRLNLYNGYGGFIDSLDPTKVKWEIGTPVALTSDQKIDKIRGIIGRGDIGDGEKYTLIKGVVA